MSTAVFIRRSRAARVAQAMCGVIWQFFAFRSGLRRGRRLDGQHVERRAGDAAGVQRVGQRLLLDERAAAGVDEEGRLLHERQPLRVDEALRLRRERAMQAHHVAAAEEVVERDELHLGSARLRGLFDREHVHPERLRDGGRLAADPAVADDPHRQALQLDQREIPVAEIRALRPAPVAHGLRVVRHVLRQLEQMREDHLRHGRRAVGRHVRHRNVPFARRLDVHDVVAGGQDADVFQLGQLPEDRRVEHGLVGEDDLRVLRARDHLVRRRAVIDLGRAERLQFVPAQIAGIQRMTVEHHDLHLAPPLCAGIRHAAIYTLAAHFSTGPYFPDYVYAVLERCYARCSENQPAP